MIVLFTDFGPGGLYTGQMKARLAEEAPAVPVIDFVDDAPRQNPRAAAYLLAAYAAAFPAGSVFVAVVDPGVGSDRPAAILEADGRWYVGPANGLFELLRRRAGDKCSIYEITWRPDELSNSFHGRDLFTPVAAMLAEGKSLPGEPRDADWCLESGWPDDLWEVIYIDGFGNAIIGVRANVVDPEIDLRVKSLYLQHARTFSDVPQGALFWYENANGLVEIAANQGSAADMLNLKIGTPVSVDGATA